MRCHVRGFKKLQCLSMLAAATPQRPLDFKSEFLAALAMCFSLLFYAPFHWFLYCLPLLVSMVKSKKRPQPPLTWQIQVCHGVNTWGNFMQENLNWSILRGAKHGKGEMKSNCSWQQSTSNFQRPSFTPKKGGSRKTTGVHASFTRFHATDFHTLVMVTVLFIYPNSRIQIVLFALSAFATCFTTEYSCLCKCSLTKEEPLCFELFLSKIT